MFPIGHVVVRVKRLVFVRVSVAATVGKPNVVAGLGGDEGRSTVGRRDDEIVRAREESMHHEDDWLVGAIHSRFVIVDPEQSIDEAVISGDLMLFEAKFGLVNDLFKGQVSNFPSVRFESVPKQLRGEMHSVDVEQDFQTGM